MHLSQVIRLKNLRVHRTKMKTLLTKIISEQQSENLQPFADILKNGGLVAFPTETVYGLGADATNATAVKKIFGVKNRPANNPLIAHIDGPYMLESIAKNIPDDFQVLFDAFWPGALTVVVDKKDVIPDVVCAGGSTVAVRCPSHPVAHELIRLSGVPIVAPSANLSGKPSPTRFEHVFTDLNGKVGGIIDGGECDIGIESTVIARIGSKAVKILRPGAITKEMLNQKGFEVEIDKHVLLPVTDNTPVASPGMLYRHYAPKAKMELVRGDDDKVIEYIKLKTEYNDKKYGVLCFDGEANNFNCHTIEYGTPEKPITLSQSLFNALREFDKTDVEMIFARVAKPEGVALGIYNRMLRAASFNVTAL